MDNTQSPLVKYLNQKYRKELTITELCEYKDRLTQFFSLLIEIDQRNKQERRKNEQKFPDKETATKADRA